VKIQGFIEPPRLYSELKHEPNSTLTPELLSTTLESSRPNPPGVCWSEWEIWIKVSRMAPGRRQGLQYIRGSINSEPSDQTNLKEQRRCNLGGDGEPTFEWGADRWGPQAGRPVGGGSHLSFASVVCLLESSGVVSAADNYDLIWRLGPPWRFSD
jgi:hypothetical protein